MPSGYFGLIETFVIPDGHVLTSSTGEVLSGDLFSNGDIYTTTDHLFLMDTSTGEIVIRIDSPVAFDTKSYDEDENEFRSRIFLTC